MKSVFPDVTRGGYVYAFCCLSLFIFVFLSYALFVENKNYQINWFIDCRADWFTTKWKFPFIVSIVNDIEYYVQLNIHRVDHFNNKNILLYNTILIDLVITITNDHRKHKSWLRQLITANRKPNYNTILLNWHTNWHTLIVLLS